MGKHFKWYHGGWELNNLSPVTTAALVEAIDIQPIPAIIQTVAREALPRQLESCHQPDVQLDPLCPPSPALS